MGRPVGYKHSEEVKQKISLKNLGNLNPMYGKTNESSHRWIGNKVGYNGLHDWVRRQLGRPSKCEHCGNNDLRPRQYHWANKSHKYKRDILDWIRLCVKCHKNYDLLSIKRLKDG